MFIAMSGRRMLTVETGENAYKQISKPYIWHPQPLKNNWMGWD